LTLTARDLSRGWGSSRKEYRPDRSAGDARSLLGGHLGHELAAELFNESRCDKSIGGALTNVRKFNGDGLFTAHTPEPNCSKAHNILLPNLG
jgi:hypothetical protein